MKWPDKVRALAWFVCTAFKKKLACGQKSNLFLALALEYKQRPFFELVFIEIISLTANSDGVLNFWIVLWIVFNGKKSFQKFLKVSEKFCGMSHWKSRWNCPSFRALLCRSKLLFTKGVKRSPFKFRILIVKFCVLGVFFESYLRLDDSWWLLLNLASALELLSICWPLPRRFIYSNSSPC